MFIPYQSILIPLVKFMQYINLYGDLSWLVLVHYLWDPITTLIFRNYYAGIGSEIIEAARIDGASLFGIYRHIMLPLSGPSFAVVIIWQFTQAWNEFLFAVILTNQSNWPVTVALNNLAGSQLVQWNVLMAATFLAALPTLLVIFSPHSFARLMPASKADLHSGYKDPSLFLTFISPVYIRPCTRVYSCAVIGWKASLLKWK
jgi:glucose/mannose transport system permease protein